MRISDWSSDVCSSDLCSSSRTFHQFEPKASLSYDLSSDASVYASFGKGFKSGGFNPIGSREALINAAAGVGLPASSVYVQDGYRSEERRVGKECVSTCSARWSPSH